MSARQGQDLLCELSACLVQMSTSADVSAIRRLTPASDTVLFTERAPLSREIGDGRIQGVSCAAFGFDRVSNPMSEAKFPRCSSAGQFVLSTSFAVTSDTLLSNEDLASPPKCLFCPVMLVVVRWISEHTAYGTLVHLAFILVHRNESTRRM